MWKIVLLRRAVEHEIQLIGDSPLQNLGLYRLSLMESDEIKESSNQLLTILKRSLGHVELSNL